MKRIVVFSGAGMSAESGLTTFRDSGGLWDQYDLNQVATPAAWSKNPELVLEFYNKRRQQVMQSEPNDAHYSLVDLEQRYDVHIVTQNIDNLHERAGSSNILHLHGEILKARGSFHEQLYDVTHDLKLGDLAEDGTQLRPHVVWFGEEVPEFNTARELFETADILLIIGTSLNVYPAAGLVLHSPSHAQVFLIDPAEVIGKGLRNVTVIRDRASVAIPRLVSQLLTPETKT